jgi:GMP synthase (glutamine-hydrolysing)
VTHPFLILETGRPVDSMRRHRGFAHWIRVAAGLGADDAVAIDAQREPLPRREGYAGVIVSGSAAMVTDRAGWSEASAAWLRDAAHAGLPLLGICYGHQLIAHALGGEVGDHPGGREIGTVDLELHPPAAQDPLFAGLPSRMAVQTTHLQTVLRAPEGATVLARSAHDACQAFRWGERVWGVQFHPEFSATHMRGYVHARRVALAREGRCAKALTREVGATPHARRLLRRFVHHARGLHR